MSADLILGIFSILFATVIGWFTIWLSLRFKAEADEVNRHTLDLLIEIKTDAKVVAAVTARELGKWGDVARWSVAQQMTGPTNISTGGGSGPASAPAAPIVVPPPSAEGTNEGD